MSKRQIIETPPSFEVGDLDGSFQHVVLVNPEIPQNTGSIARLCAGTRTWLHLVKPLGYVLEDRYLKRAGLDYWPSVRLSTHETMEAAEAMIPWDRALLFTKRAEPLHFDRSYGIAPVLVFGCETKGLPEDLLARHWDRAVRLPTTGSIRSLNLSNSVSIAVFEGIRQSGWRGEVPMSS